MIKEMFQDRYEGDTFPKVLSVVIALFGLMIISLIIL